MVSAISQSPFLVGFHPEMVLFANLAVHLRVFLWGDRRVASGQTLDFLHIGEKSSFPHWKRGCNEKTFPDDYSLRFEALRIPRPSQKCGCTARRSLMEKLLGNIPFQSDAYRRFQRGRSLKRGRGYQVLHGGREAQGRPRDSDHTRIYRPRPRQMSAPLEYWGNTRRPSTPEYVRWF